MRTCLNEREKATDSALRFLAAGRKNESEIRALLLKKKYSAGTVDAAILFLKNKRLLYERPLNADGADHLSEDRKIEKIVLKRLLVMKGLPAMKARKRLYDYLLRRGFDADLVEEALNKILGTI